MADQFIGEIRLLPYSFNPDEWLQCAGQYVSIAEYTALYSIIGTYYGGDGRTFFQLPYLCDTVPMHTGLGISPGLSPHFLGQKVGYSLVSLGEANLPKHTHSAKVALALGTTDDPDSSMYPAVDTSPTLYVYKQDATDLQPMGQDAVALAGQSQGHENRQPFMSLRYCIAWSGIYPQRP